MHQVLTRETDKNPHTILYNSKIQNLYFHSELLQDINEEGGFCKN